MALCDVMWEIVKMFLFALESLFSKAEPRENTVPDKDIALIHLCNNNICKYQGDVLKKMKKQSGKSLLDINATHY